MTHQRWTGLITAAAKIAGALFAFTVCVVRCESTFAIEPLTGKPFEGALAQRIGRAWGGQDGNTLRGIVRQLSDSQRVSILLDRRIDPTQSVELTLPPTPLRDVLSALAHKVNAELSILGNVAYLGPTDSAKKLRTLVELRNSELSKLANSAAGIHSPWRTRSLAWTSRKSFRWQDLDRPRDLLEQVSDQFRIEIDNPGVIPHDLWAASSMPQVTATEAFSLLLVQFGSTFEFVPDRVAIRIVPLPERVAVERSYPIPVNSPVNLGAARKRFPEAEIEQVGTKFIVHSTVELHSEFALWLRPGTSPNGQSPDEKPRKPLNDRRFTLKQRNVPLGAVIKTFTDYGVTIRFDPVEFEQAKVSLDTKADIDVKEVSVEKLFRDLFEPHGIEVNITGETVWLKPKANNN
jgi:hypothetical protein